MSTPGPERPPEDRPLHSAGSGVSIAEAADPNEDGPEQSGDKEPELSATLAKELERLKWFLWHGNVVRALELVEEVEDLVAASEETEGSQKLRKAVRRVPQVHSKQRPSDPQLWGAAPQWGKDFDIDC